MIVKEIMHATTKIPFDATVADAAKIMDEKDIGSVLVEKEGKIAGILTERDVLRKLVNSCLDPCNTKVQDLMSFPLITVNPNTDISEASKIMDEKHIRRLIVKEEENIVGILTSRDIANNVHYMLAKKLVGN